MNGEEQNVDPAAIERQLAELWKSGEKDSLTTTRAALWNVVAHTESDERRNEATEILSSASISVPQRSILIRASPDDDDSLMSWISANCHLVGAREQVCSEQISITAGGKRVQHVPSLVNALLIPDMPVATWWIGDLPNENRDYTAALLEPADRLIVDSMEFDSVGDLQLVDRISRKTRSLSADLNWMRLEEWRIATATLFDNSAMRERLHSIRALHLVSSAPNRRFGQGVGSLYYASWLATLVGYTMGRRAIEDNRLQLDCRLELREDSGGRGELETVRIEFDDGSTAILEHNTDGRAIHARADVAHAPSTVTPIRARKTSELVVRQLSHRDEDTLFARVLPVASDLAEELSR